VDKQKYKVSQWKRRKRRIRKKVAGDPQRPRLSVFRSLRQVYVQIIDDDNGLTLVAAGSQEKDVSAAGQYGGSAAAAAKVGELIARKALALGIRTVRFDRSGYKYHGRVRALAEAARKAGLVF